MEGLRKIRIEGILVFPTKEVWVQHQYWVSGAHQSHQMVTMARPSQRAISEAHRHFHKVVVADPTLPLPGRGTKLFAKSGGQEIPAYQFSDILEQKGAAIGKGPDATNDVLDEIVGVLAPIAKMLLPS